MLASGRCGGRNSQLLGVASFHVAGGGDKHVDNTRIKSAAHQAPIERGGTNMLFDEDARPYQAMGTRKTYWPAALASLLVAVGILQVAVLQQQAGAKDELAEMRSTLSAFSQMQAMQQRQVLAQEELRKVLVAGQADANTRKDPDMSGALTKAIADAAASQSKSFSEAFDTLSKAKSKDKPSTAMASDSALPHKHLIDGLTPSADQMFRGDCWLFATTGILEDSYRRYGVSKGWFPKDKYLRLSRQALGIASMELCKKYPNSFCTANIGPKNSIIWGNTTEGLDGADEHLFAYLKDVGDIGALPDSVCPYSPVADYFKERECDGLDKARKTNPLKFKVTAMRGHYERGDIKRALVEEGKPLSLGMGMVWAPFYLPCTGGDGPGACDPATAECVKCPLQRVYQGIECCVLVNRPMVSMKGEWFIQPDEPLVVEGGHAVNIVGYSDTYRDEYGNTGGYILRNTWADGLGTAHGLKARGSHTAAFYMGLTNDFEEGLACPNPHSPRQWFPCDDLETCKSSVAMVEANSFSKVMRLKCIDLGFTLPAGACQKDRAYYVKNMTEFGSSGLFITCFIYDGGESDQGSMCYPPLTMDDLATIFTPEDIDTLPKNDKALCGFNFLPYVVHERLMARFGSIISTTYDIEWPESSYVSHKAKGYDYSLIEESTHELATIPVFKPKNFY